MLIDNFLKAFLSFFKIINENRQLNIIKSINKEDDGKIILVVGPINNDTSTKVSPYAFIKNNVLMRQFSQSDIKLIKAILIAEGDIFIKGKDYENGHEVFILESLLETTIWKKTKSEIMECEDIKSRLNKKYFKYYIEL